jgi:glycosyltransferase involved in cell wall biosynthesis
MHTHMRQQKVVNNLLIIIVSRNEEGIIGSSIQSAINAVIYASSYVKSVEIILVDGNSTDKTVDIAGRFPITILQQKEKYKGISAGRHVGYEYARPRCGKYVLFLDGDIILPETWLSDTIKYINQNPKVAGVSGPQKLLQINNKFEPTSSDVEASTSCHVYGSPKEYLHGAVLYRKKVLEVVGSFDPSMLGEEDCELGFRIRQANFELHELNIPPTIHLIQKNKTWFMHRAGYYRGLGQEIRKHFRTSLSRHILRQYWFHFSLPIWIFLSCLMLFLIFYNVAPSSFLVLIVSINISAFLIVLKLEHGLTKAIYKLCRTLIESYTILIGLTIRNQNKITLPNDSAKLLKKGDVLQVNLLNKGYSNKNIR